MPEHCAAIKKISDLALQRRYNKLYWLGSCEDKPDMTDELMLITFANWLIPSDDFTMRMTNLGVCDLPACDGVERPMIASCDFPLFVNLEAMIIAGCASIYNPPPPASSSPGGVTGSYPIKATSYTAIADDTLVFVVAELIGKRLISITRPLSVVTPAQFLFDEETGEISLVNGVFALSNLETVLLTYEDLP